MDPAGIDRTGAGDQEVAADDTSHRPVDIFISYRVRPDEDLAGEMKTLLESSLDPRPNVFVSGLGGLRVSADSYREQLRQAAIGARAYIALITKASIDREWIFFEAGAAFGRRVLYAPVLVDVTPTELPSSLGGYQAVVARDQTRMSDLINDVAKAIGAQPRRGFQGRYARFCKALENSGKEPREEPSRLQLAIKLAELGRRDEAIALFDELEGQATTPESRADIRIMKLCFLEKDSREIFRHLEQQPPEVKATATFKMWIGFHETNPVKAARYLREALEGNLKTTDRAMALTCLARTEFQLGHSDQAVKRLLDALAVDNRHLRAEAAQALAAHVDGKKHVLGKLFLLVEATSDSTLEHLDELARYCWEHRIANIGLHVAWACVSESSTGFPHLHRGLFRDLLGLRSLAFADFRTAAMHGESVAKSNMASLLNSGAVAEAGLEILREHVGAFDAADPGAPYDIRAKLERAIAEEKEIESVRRAEGDRLEKAIHRFLDSWRRCRSSAEYLVGQWRSTSKGGEIRFHVDSENVCAFVGDKRLSIAPLYPFDGIFAAEVANGRLVVSVCGDIEGVLIEALEGAGDVEWLQFRTLSDEEVLEHSASEVIDQLLGQPVKVAP